MKMRWCWCGLCLLAQAGHAADLGSWGDLYPVSEKDMLGLITQRLKQSERFGEWPEQMAGFKERVITHSQRPMPVPGIKQTDKYQSRYFDPSVQIAEELKDDKGRVFARKGEVMNPLKFVPFMQTLYFINGDDPEQVEWMKRQKPATLQVKIILIQGDIPKTSAALNNRIYFDQNGVLCARFGIQQVPTRITPAPGSERLHIESLPVDMQP